MSRVPEVNLRQWSIILLCNTRTLSIPFFITAIGEMLGRFSLSVFVAVHGSKQLWMSFIPAQGPKSLPEIGICKYTATNTNRKAAYHFSDSWKAHYSFRWRAEFRMNTSLNFPIQNVRMDRIAFQFRTQRWAGYVGCSLSCRAAVEFDSLVCSLPRPNNRNGRWWTGLGCKDY
jgi:hypothetical protein